MSFWGKILKAIRRSKPVFRDTIVSLARAEVGIVETSRNQGKGIEKYWTATWYSDGYAKREPYCAAFVCWVVKSAMEQCGIESTGTFRRPRTPSAWGMEKWSLAQDSTTRTLINPGHDIQPGDIVVFAFSHVGIAISPVSDDGYVFTVEGNTNAAGSRDGNGVFEKARHVSQIRSRIRFTI